MILRSNTIRSHRLGSAALAIVLAAGLAGCKTTQSENPTEALALATPNGDADWRRSSYRFQITMT